MTPFILIVPMRYSWLFILCAPALLAQSTVDWPMYNRDLSGTRYSPLMQINARNVVKLEKAWSYHVAAASEATPIVVNGVMYLPAAKSVVALEPATGKEIWTYEVSGPLSRQRRGLLAGR